MMEELPSHPVRRLSPRQADEVRHALRLVERFVALNSNSFSWSRRFRSGERYEGSCIVGRTIARAA